ncbi:MAG: TonB-dependent receptor [Bacteroidota bacterium]
MKKLKLMMLPVLLCLFTSAAYAQFTVKGVVSDANGEPLIGATVVVKGTAKGTATDVDGSFSIEVDGSSATLEISYTGFSTKEVAVSPSNSNLTIALDDAVSALDEVVVVGYGSTRKEALTGSVTTLTSDALESVPLASVEQTLQGNVAGLQANMGNGQPGANVQIRIRGQGSISASAEPLYVIDGIPVASGSLTNSTETSNPMATINPNDIETVTVLKDASATAIYGSRAANGVILITTKSGKTGKPKVRFTAQVGANDWAVNDDRRLRSLDAAQYTDLYLEGWVNRGETVQEAIDRFNNQYPDPISGNPAVDITDNGNGTWSLGTIRVDNNWLEELSRTGINQDYNVNVSGGTDVVNYYTSAGYFKQEAPIIGSELERYSARVNLGINASKRLKFTNNLTISHTAQMGMNDGTRWANPMYNGYLLAPVIPARNAEGLFYDGHKSFFMGGNNPIGSLSGDDTQEWTIVRIIDNLTASFEILDGLTFKTAWSIDLTNFRENYFRNARYGDGRNSGGFGSETTDNNTNWIGTQTLTYFTSFNDAHNLDFLVGYEAQNSQSRRVTATGEEFPPNPNLRTLNNAAISDPATSSLFGFAFESLFGQVSYNYNYKYYLSASVRRDGSSRFGVENRYGTFWSIGGSWRLDQEPFIQDIGFINELKLRSSYGVTGNAGIGNFDHLPLISFSGIDYDGAPGGAFSSIGNTELTWEESKSFNIGLDFAVANSAINGTLEYFRRESDNLLLDVPISRTTGFGSVTRNFGAMVNRGVELTLNASIINQADFNWSVGGNITFLQNEITRLDEPFLAGTHDRFRREEGRDYNEYYMFGWAGVNPDDGSPLFYTDATETTTTSNINEIDRYYQDKSGNPDFFGGFNTFIKYKGFSIDAKFTYSWGNWLYDATAWVLQGDGRFTPRSQSHLVLDRWQQPGDVTEIPRFEWGNRSNSNLRGSTRFLLDGSHVRLRNLTVAYDLPTALVSKLRMTNARVYLRGINLLTFTRDPDLYADPEADVNGFINSPVPNLRTISFGIDVGF